MIELRHSDEEIELSVVSPVYNEEKNIDYFFLQNYCQFLSLWI